VFAPSASAHYDLVGTDPAADSVVTELPAQISLTFSGNLLSDPGATVIEVVDSAGGSLLAGDPVVDGAVVTAPIAGTATGDVTVRWKVVYDDGHPGSDEFAFTVEAPAPPPTPTPTSSRAPFPTPTQTINPGPTTSPTPTVLPGPPMAAIDLTPWLIGGGVLLVAVGGAVTYLLVSRARRQQALEEGSSGRSEPPAGR
jgi:copper resistance protein C